MIPNIDTTIYRRPAELLSNLIRFNTTNPPGNEGECIHYIAQLLTAAGIETHVLAKDPNRPNLVARLQGRKRSDSPLLIYGHVDVVAADPGKWVHPPFSGDIADGFVWGRGALDMKGGIAMMVGSFLKAKIEESPLNEDILLCLLSDEEEMGEFGSDFMVSHHADYFNGVKYALSEFGGFTLYIGNKTFYPIEILQKQKCIIKAVLRGPTGHGSNFMRGGAVATLSQMLDQLDKNLLPVHVTPVVDAMFRTMSENLPFPNGAIMRLLTKPRATDFVLNLLGKKGHAFIPMFHNIVNATIIRGGEKINIIPGEIEVHFDVRILPGLSPDDVIDELRSIIGEEVRLEVLHYDHGQSEPDMGLFEMLAGIIRESDPEGIPVPFMLTGCSDARFFSRLGIQTYGFMPMQLPQAMNFNHLIHSADERIPVDTLTFGMNALGEAMKRYTGIPPTKGAAK
ncbi:MAG: M20/M25/M40 family metallo-hydrolase [Candidatus Omnitrophota bacterium]